MEHLITTHVCCYCKSILDAEGNAAQQLTDEEYDALKTERTDVSHGVCHVCADKQRVAMGLKPRHCNS